MLYDQFNSEMKIYPLYSTSTFAEATYIIPFQSVLKAFYSHVIYQIFCVFQFSNNSWIYDLQTSVIYIGTSLESYPQDISLKLGGNRLGWGRPSPHPDKA